MKLDTDGSMPQAGKEVEDPKMKGKDALQGGDSHGTFAWSVLDRLRGTRPRDGFRPTRPV